jgi:hypothetical protein
VSSPILQDSVAAKYLDRYGTAETGHLKSFPGRYQRAVVIPAFAEPVEFLHQLRREPLSAPGTLTILVINAPVNATTENIAFTRELAAHLVEFGQPIWASDNMDLRETPSGSAVLTVHRYEENHRLPDRCGVGLARRIGCDCALRLFLDGRVHDPLIRNTDADARLPGSWFDTAATDAGGVVYPFTHRPPEDPALTLAGQLYELSLHYYVLGLRWAGSPFAFHSVGSTIAVDARAYARVRGFPKRSGGEDFYLLNKLAKVSTIHCPTQPFVELETRPSERVPFGTGPAVNRIARLERPTEELKVYDSRCFDFVREWIRQFEQFWSDGERGASHRVRKSLSERFPADMVRDWADEFDIDDALGHAFKHADSKAAFVRHMHVWFDAFRTLKTVHFLRNRCFASQPLTVTFLNAPFLLGTRMLLPETLASVVEDLRAQCWDKPRDQGVDADY